MTLAASTQIQTNTAPGQPLRAAGVVEYFDHFHSAGYITNATMEGKFSETADRGEWLVTVVDGGTDNAEAIVIADDAPGGWLKITTNDAASDGVQAQKNGESFKIAAGKMLIIEAQIALGDIDAIRWFFGLCITDTTILDEDTGSSDYFGFGSYNASSGVHGAPDGSIAFMVAKNATGSKAPGAKTTGETTGDTGVNFPADATDTTLNANSRTVRMEVTKDRIEAFVDGSLVGTVTTNIPDDETLTPSFAFDAHGAAAEVAYINYIGVVTDNAA